MFESMKKDKVRMITLIGMAVMIIAVAVKAATASVIAAAAIHVAGLACFFLVEGIEKTPDAESGLSFKRFFPDLKKPGVLPLILLMLVLSPAEMLLSKAVFGSAYIESVVTVFMFLFGVNFNLYFLIFIGHWKEALKSEELHWYLGIIFGSVLLLSLGIYKIYGSLGETLHQAFFNVGTLMSTTGFGTVDFTETWPEYGKWILMLLMLCGACAGSTGGGIKVSRLIILCKSGRAELRQMIRPRSVLRVEMDSKRVERSTVKAATTFFAMYMALLLLFSFLVSLDGVDIATSFTAALSCLSNIGPGMTRAIGPAGSFAFFSDGTKLLLSLAMLMGRLEIYPILVLLSPRTWKR